MGHDQGENWDESYKDWKEGIVKVHESRVPKELKHKKGVPTVIEYQGRRYVLDNGKR